MHLEFEAPEELRHAIKCFWYNSQDFGDQLSDFEVMPDGYAEIIFHFGSGCSILSNGSRKSLTSPFMMGLLNQPVLFSSQHVLQIIAIRCFPWTVFDLLGIKSDQDNVRLIEHPISQLQPVLNQLVGAGQINEAIEQIKNYFLNALSQVPVDSMLFKAGVAMRNANGTIPVSQVAAAAHATIRTLERKFKQSTGHTVKDVSAIMRFEQVRNQLWLQPDSNLAALAHELGYADQSHLSREFKRYSGSTPSAFARKAKKGKQIVSSDFVAFVQA